MTSPFRRALSIAHRVCLWVVAIGAGFLMLAQPAAAAGAAQKPAPARPEPTYTCAAANGDGTFTYFFGYTLAGNSPVTVPIGALNQFSGAKKNLGQPTTFRPGSHPNAFATTTAIKKLQWQLNGENLNANSSKLCINVPVVSEAPAALALPLAGAAPFAVWFATMRRRARNGRTRTT
jgi:hypothetical protein